MNILKKILAVTLSTILVVTAIPVSGFAQGEGELVESTYRPYFGAEYMLKYQILDDDTVKITGTEGNPKGELKLPDTIDGKKVTVIGSSAFTYNTELTGQLNLPKNLKIIEGYAFRNCSGITGDINIPEGVTTIGNHAFSNCIGLNGQLTLPNTVLEIGRNAFANCCALTGGVMLPEKIKKIDDYAFRKCSNLSGDLVIPKDVEEIGMYAFAECGPWEGDLEMPGVKTIGEGAFLDTTFENVQFGGSKLQWDLYQFKPQYNGTLNVADNQLNALPEKPANFVARLSKLAGGYDDIYCYWSKSQRATGYKVYYRKPAEDQDWSYKGKTAKTSYLFKNLRDGVQYQVKVVPYVTIKGEDYQGQGSKIARVTTLKKLPRPAIYKSSPTSVKVKWTNIKGESGYQISRSRGKHLTFITFTYKTTTSSYKTLKTFRERGYYYKVRAYKNVVVNGKTYKVVGPWSETRYYKLH